jgi:hypothetical protein
MHPYNRRQSVLSIYYSTLSYWSFFIVLFLLTFGSRLVVDVHHLRITAFVSHPFPLFPLYRQLHQGTRTTDAVLPDTPVHSFLPVRV